MLLFIYSTTHLLKIFIDHLLCAEHHASYWDEIIMSKTRHGRYLSGDYGPEGERGKNVKL